MSSDLPINHLLAQYSDLAYYASFIIYTLAFLMFIGYYATVKGNQAKNRDHEADRELALASARSSASAPVAVGAGDIAAGHIGSSSSVAASSSISGGERTGTVGVQDSVQGSVDEDGRPLRSLDERLGRLGYMLVVLGFIGHIATLVLRGLSAGRVPWGNLYEFVVMTVACAILAGLIGLRKQHLWSLWVFLLTPALILLFVAGVYLYADTAPVVPALKSNWLAIHVSIICVGSGLFLVAGVVSVMYLLKMRSDSQRDRADTRFGKLLARWVRPMPSAEILDQIAYRCTIIGFPIFGIGVICGAIWAEAAWGRFWGWDPKETLSLVTWIVYAAYLHARATSGWRDAKAAWINVLGFLMMLANLFLVNLVISGLHSYAGLN